MSESEAPAYVIDRDGTVWLLVRDGGMATRATATGVVSAGIAWLEAEAGPLMPFDAAGWRRAALAWQDIEARTAAGT